MHIVDLTLSLVYRDLSKHTLSYTMIAKNRSRQDTITLVFFYCVLRLQLNHFSTIFFSFLCKNLLIDSISILNSRKATNLTNLKV